MSDWNAWLTRWADAGLLDAAAAARIRAYETEHAGSGRLRWPAMAAIAFGALMLGGGVLLFVAAHWDALSPGARFAIVLTMVGGFHVLGALVGDSVPGLSAGLHGVGTVALGAGISLVGQIFNLDEHWPSGILAWAAGAAAAWAVLRQTPQVVLLAILVPAWLLDTSFPACTVVDVQATPSPNRSADCSHSGPACAVRDGSTIPSNSPTSAPLSWPESTQARSCRPNGT